MSMDNPFLDPDFAKRVEESLPPDHPARERRTLTLLQSFALPILMWFFEGSRSIGTGRSRLYAHVCIQLAMRGDKIVLYDTSIMPFHGVNHRAHEHFAHQVMDLVKTDYKRCIFEFRTSTRELVFKGMRPI